MESIIAGPPAVNIDCSEPEIWVRRRPEMGDHIRVMRVGGLYAHHGVYVSDDEIIHFTGTEDDSILDWSKPEVIKSDLDYFLKGGVLEVKEYTEDEFKDLYSPEQIVVYARACLGDKGYHLAFNNCEHFANVCTLGRFRSNQVERVLSGRLPNEEDKDLGFLGKIGSAIKNFLGGGSSGGSRSVSTYEPDKVKIAEIESDTKIRLAHMENDRIELMKQARMDMLQFETESRIALEQAKAQGLTVMAQTILTLQEKLNEVAEKRLLIIEKGSLQIIKDIETFYDELGTKIQEDDDRYNTEKLPELLSILEKYEEGSPSHKIYMKRIEEDMALQAKHYAMQIEAVSRRQSQVIDGFMQSKDRIMDQTGQITAGMLEAVQNQALELNTSAQKALDGEKAALPGGEKPTLTDGAKCFS